MPPFATLSSLTIYDAELALKESASNAERALFFHTDGSTADAWDGGDEAGTDKVKLKERCARVVGTAMGIRDFARMLGADSPASPSVRSVHSLKQRTVWVEPEPDIFLHAVINLPRVARTVPGTQVVPSHPRDASGGSATSTRTARPSRTTYLYLASAVEDDAVIFDLERAYARFRLTHGTIRECVKRDGETPTREAINRYWHPWTSSWRLDKTPDFAKVASVLQMSRLHDPLATQLDPLMLQFATSNPAARSLLMHGRDVLHSGARSEAVPEDELISLVDYLVESIPLEAAPVSTREPTKAKAKKRTSTKRRAASAAAAAEKSRWDQLTFGMSSYLPASSALSLPPTSALVPNLSAIPGLATLSSRPSTPTSTSAETTRSASWSLPGFKWGGRATSDSAATAQPAEDAAPPKLEPSASRPGTPESTSSSIEQLQARTGHRRSTSLATDGGEKAPSIVDMDSLSSAFDETLAIPSPSTEEPAPTFGQSAVHLSGSPHTDVLWCQRGPLTLLLVCLDTLDNGDKEWLIRKAHRLLEAVETVLEPATVPSLDAEPEHIVTDGQLARQKKWSASSDKALDAWSGKASSAEIDILTALFADRVNMRACAHPRVSRTVVRLQSSEWVASARVPPIHAQSTNVHAVLPAKIGREGSLIDATDALERILQNL